MGNFIFVTIILVCYGLVQMVLGSVSVVSEQL